MIYELKEKILDRLESLPKTYKVLDVGGASSPFSRADVLIDIVDYEGINWDQIKGDKNKRISKENFIKHDICSREAWPLKDKEFDYVTCSHVLEDIRDPLWVCSELIRVSKSGYIEIPSRSYETTFNLETRGLAGASHHRWIIDLDEQSKLRFTFKYMHAHLPGVNKNRNVYDKSDENMYLRLEWKESFDFYENWLNSGKEIFEYYLKRKLTEKEVSKVFRNIGPRGRVIEWLAYLKRITRKHE